MIKTQLYKHYNAANELIYVGIAKDAVARLKRHPFASTVVRTEITVFKSKEEAAAAELAAILTEKPKLNVKDVPRDDRRGRYMTTKQYRDAIAQLGLSQGTAAKWMGISIRTSHGYANGEVIPKSVAELLRLTIKLKLQPEDME